MERWNSRPLDTNQISICELIEHMEKAKKMLATAIQNPLARGSAIVFVGSIVANIGAYAYHLIIGRILGPTGYGELSSLISLLYIVSVPNTVVQTILVKYFSSTKANNEIGQAKDIVIRSMKWISLSVLIGLIITLISAPYIQSFLNLRETSWVLGIYCIFVSSLYSIVSSSVLQGYQKFLWLSVMSAIAIVVKIVLSIPLAAWGVGWTILATIISSLIIISIFFYAIKFVLSAKRKRFPMTKKDILKYGAPTFMTLLGITSMYSTDIMLVKHYFPAHEAGVYAALSVLGKVIFFASSAVSSVIFPVLSERKSKKENTDTMVWLGAAIVGSISLAITTIYFLFPSMVLHILFGPAYDDAVPYLGLFGIFLSFFSLTNIFTLILLALDKMNVWIIIAIGAITQIGCIMLFHNSIMDIVTINITVTAILSLSVIGYYLKTKEQV